MTMYIGGKVGGEKWLFGQFTVEAKHSTMAASHYFKSASKVWYVEVDSVRFGEKDPGVNCLASCDAGAVHQPTCDGQGNKTSANQTENQNTANNNGGSANTEDIKQKIVENLRSHIFTGKGSFNANPSFREQRMDQYTDSISDVKVELAGDVIAISYRYYVQRDVDDAQHQRHRETNDHRKSVNLDLSKLSSSLSIVNSYGYASKFAIGAIGQKCSDVDSSNYSGQIRTNANNEETCISNIPFDAGPNNQNFNELKALVAQLAGQPTGPAGNSLNDLKKRYVEFLNARYNRKGVKPFSVASDGQFQYDYNNSSCKLDFRWLMPERERFGNGPLELGRWIRVDDAGKPVNRAGPSVNGSCGGNLIGTVILDTQRDIDEELSLLQNIRNYQGSGPTANSNQPVNNSPGGSSAPAGNNGESNSGKPEVLPQAAFEQYQAGDQQFRAKNYEAAIDSFKRALDLAPNSPVLNLNLGLAYGAAGKPNEAIAPLQRVVEIQPTNVAAYELLWRYLNQLKRTDEAIEWLKKGVRAVPDNAQLWYNLGDRVSATSKSGAEGLTFFQRSVELDPKCVHCHRKLADAFAAVEQWDAAVRTYETLFRLVPRDARLMPYEELMKAYNKVGKYNEVIATYQNMLTYADKRYIDRTASSMHFELGLAYCGLKDKPNAMAEYEKLKPCPDCNSPENDELMKKIRATWPTAKPKGRRN
jgi:tetratricopeptide (TPR) repeat protein